jgi:hypothetical protein
MNKIEDIKLMASLELQDYYGSQYNSFQRKVVFDNKLYLDDKKLIRQIIINSKFYGNILDIGSGNCQWFEYFEPTILNYFALDLNTTSLNKSVDNIKLTKINLNIFESNSSINKCIPEDINYVLFSFFLSHFSNKSINQLFKKIEKKSKIIIVDSFWSSYHKEKHKSNKLKLINRKISKNEKIKLPKRFFDYQEIKSILFDLNYRIVRFDNGNNWFICIAERYNPA